MQDLGYLDKQGFLYINGRLKDLIVTGGQVDALIGQMPAIVQCAVVGLPDSFRGESVTCARKARSWRPTRSSSSVGSIDRYKSR